MVKDLQSIRTTVQASEPPASRNSVHTFSNSSVWERDSSEVAYAPREVIVTRDQKQDALKMWKDLMSTTNDYKPSHQRSEEDHLKDIKFLKSAMADFRFLKLKGLAALRSEHSNFLTVQSRYFIP